MNQHHRLPGYWRLWVLAGVALVGSMAAAIVSYDYLHDLTVLMSGGYDPPPVLFPDSVESMKMEMFSNNRLVAKGLIFGGITGLVGSAAGYFLLHRPYQNVLGQLPPLQGAKGNSFNPMVGIFWCSVLCGIGVPIVNDAIAILFSDVYGSPSALWALAAALPLNYWTYRTVIDKPIRDHHRQHNQG